MHFLEQILKTLIKTLTKNGKTLNFNKNGTESKMENPTRGFREMNLVLRLI